MFKKAKRRGAALVAVLTTALGLGFATPALADETLYAELSNAYLTKVIDAPLGTNATGDVYVFHFAGGGEVTEKNDNTDQGPIPIYSDGVKQDVTTLSVHDVVPTIPDVTLKGANITADNSQSKGKYQRSIVQKPLSEILVNIKWPHAGVYTYDVTESSASTKLNEYYINASKAQYLLRVRVKNAHTGENSVLNDTQTIIEGVTVEQLKKNNGEALDSGVKVNPTYPQKEANSNKVAAEGDASVDNWHEIEEGKLPGFTFTNTYVHGGSFTVKKLYDGAFSDRTKLSTVELKIYSEAAVKSTNENPIRCVSYVVENGGVDLTKNNMDSQGEHARLNGVYDVAQANHSMAMFDEDGWCYITAGLKEGSCIRITGEYGEYSPDYEKVAPNHKDRRRTFCATGLLDGHKYYVEERNLGHYRPTGYVYIGTNASADPRKDDTGMTRKNHVGDSPINDKDGNELFAAWDLSVEGTTEGSATTVFVVNVLDENKVSVTGVLIDNLPYILMVGIPVAVFTAMFVAKLRENAAA